MLKILASDFYQTRGFGNMKKRTILIICILAISIVAITRAQVSKIGLTQVNDCKDIEWETEEPIMGTCQREIVNTICDDPPQNQSCYQETNYYDYPCQTGTKKVQHSDRACSPKAFEVTKEDSGRIMEKGRITFDNWGLCSYEKEGDTLIILCDSKYDGNNDGVCQSGESCIKFVIDENGVQRTLRNSQDDFTEEDQSFKLDKLGYEVVE